MYIGIDIVEIKRIQKFFSGYSGFLSRIYTEREIAYCQQMKRTQYQHLAARFATKEAVFKALGTGWRGKMKWTDIEVLNDELGKPYLNLYGAVKEAAERKNVKDTAVSLSHCQDYAIAEVLLISNAECGMQNAECYIATSPQSPPCQGGDKGEVKQPPTIIPQSEFRIPHS